MTDWRITTDHYDGAQHPDRAHPRDVEPWDNPWEDRYDKQLELRPAWANGKPTKGQQ
jgi:hypothetical protein